MCRPVDFVPQGQNPQHLQPTGIWGTARRPFPTLEFLKFELLQAAFFNTQRVRCKGFCSAPFFLPGRVRQVAIGTCRVGLCEKAVAQRIFISFQRLQFSISGKLGILFDINVFFEQNLYKVFGFQWTNRKICCIIISFLCCGRKAVIYWKR